VARVEFNPADPESVERAIEQMKAAVDAKVGKYTDNPPLVITMAEELKKQFEDEVRQRALSAHRDAEVSDQSVTSSNRPETTTEPPRVFLSHASEDKERFVLASQRN